MALFSSITASLYNPIGLLGQSAGFTPFTSLEKENLQYQSRGYNKTVLLSDALFAGMTTDTDGKVALVTATQVAVDALLPNIYDVVADTVTVKIYISNVVFSSKPDVAVIADSVNSPYVERDSTVTVTYFYQVLVS